MEGDRDSDMKAFVRLRNDAGGKDQTPAPDKERVFNDEEPSRNFVCLPPCRLAPGDDRGGGTRTRQRSPALSVVALSVLLMTSTALSATALAAASPSARSFARATADWH